jgi:putative Holliday junction resolvase
VRRLLGLDYGGERIGVALSDESGLLASPHSVIRHRGWGPSAGQVSRLMAELGCEYVVLGLPRNMDGTLGDQACEAQGFGERLMREGLRVVYVDERLSSIDAEEKLREGGYRGGQIKGKVDQAAAAIILQEHLDGLQTTSNTTTGGTQTMANEQDKQVDLAPEEEESNIVELTDEDGVVTEFEYLSTIEHKGESYVVLLAPQEEENEEEGEVLILKIEQDEKGEDTYVTCDSEEVEQEVFELFMEEMDEEEDAAE